ncbi:MAG: hypothetical protein CME88_09935 [Hirschia sp.]|nr:hypothetical protein [Hirschia sp.]MBF18687.1 hypothetical protein [Hirschia sp.]
MRGILTDAAHSESSRVPALQERPGVLSTLKNSAESALWSLRFAMANPLRALRGLRFVNPFAPLTGLWRLLKASGLVTAPLVMIAAGLCGIAALMTLLVLIIIMLGLLYSLLPHWVQGGVFAGFGLIGLLIALAAMLLSLLLVGLAIYYTREGLWAGLLAWWLQRGAWLRDWASSITSEMRVVRGIFPEAANKNGFFLSMAPPTQFPPQPARPILFEDDRHVCLLAGSRAGKGRAYIIPNLTQWRGSTIAFDPSGELYRETARYRREVLGQKVVLLDPFGVTGDATDQWNPMAEINFDHDPLAIDKAYLLAESLIEDRGSDPYWVQAPRKMLAMMIAHIGSLALPEDQHLGIVRDLLMLGDLGRLWNELSENEAFDGLIRRFGESNVGRGEQELASTMEVARTAMKWLDSGLMERFCRASTFSMRELKDGQTSIYIVLPAGMGDSYKAWLRILFNAAFDAMQDQTIPKPDIATLFVLDEFPLLGKMPRIQRAAGEAAKFGIRLLVAAQDVTQLKEHYGDAWETFVANSGALIMFSNNDLATQEYLSRRLGKELYRKISTTQGGQSSSTTSTWELREVARPDQAEKLVSRQSGEAFVFIAGRKPMRLPRANYDTWGMTDIPGDHTENEEG